MKHWYVVQVYAGYEELVKKDISRRIKEEGLEESFGEVLVPSAKVKGLFEADAQKADDQQLFPGYLLVEMLLSPVSMRLVLSTPKVLRFLGGKDPAALSKKEVDRITLQMKGEVVVPGKKSEFVEGREVEINEGPFAGFVGIIDKIEDEAEKLTVMVSIFGRMTPVELRFDQVKH